MRAAPPILRLIKRILEENPRAAIVLAEILGPPPGLEKAPPKPWEEA